MRLRGRVDGPARRGPDLPYSGPPLNGACGSGTPLRSVMSCWLNKGPTDLRTKGPPAPVGYCRCTGLPLTLSTRGFITVRMKEPPYPASSSRRDPDAYATDRRHSHPSSSSTGSGATAARARITAHDRLLRLAAGAWLSIRWRLAAQWRSMMRRWSHAVTHPPAGVSLRTVGIRRFRAAAISRPGAER